MHIDLTIDPDFAILPAIGQAIGRRPEGGVLTLPPEIGRGRIRQWRFPGGVHLLFFDFQLGQSISFRTLNPPEEGIFTLFINLAGGGLVSTFDHEEVGMGTQQWNGIVFFHPSESVVHCPAGAPFRFLVIGFSAAGLAAYRSERPDSELVSLLQMRKNFWLFEEVDLELGWLLEKVRQGVEDSRPDLLLLHALVLQSLHLVLGRLARREERRFRNIHQEDLEKLFQARAFIVARLQARPTIPYLAHRVGLSESKLKKLFKVVFGKSVYAYGRYVRMLEAQRLLSTGRYNLSQAAAQVGYQNLTHFSRAFEEVVGIRPGAFLKKGRH